GCSGDKWQLQQINCGTNSNCPSKNPNATTDGPPASGGPFVNVYSGHDQQHFGYLAANGEIWDAFFCPGCSGNKWQLQQINLSGVASVKVDDCWCGPSYFKGSDNVGRVVSSGGLQVKQWTVNTANTPALALEASAPALQPTGQDGGFFTSISSDGTNANTAIIWAVGRPVGNNNELVLYAFDATASGGVLKQLWSGLAGTWPNTGGNSNVVPTVANGRAYVAGYKQLRIFGLVPPKRLPPRRAVGALPPAAPAGLAQFTPATGPLYWGTIREVNGSRVTLELRNGRHLTVDVSKVLPQATSDFGAIGRALAVSGTMGPDGVLAA